MIDLVGFGLLTHVVTFAYIRNYATSEVYMVFNGYFGLPSIELPLVPNFRVTFRSNTSNFAPSQAENSDFEP